MSDNADRRMPADAADWVRKLLAEEAGSSEELLRRHIDGIEKMLREEIPVLKEVVDVTDHASGANPFYAHS